MTTELISFYTWHLGDTKYPCDECRRRNGQTKTIAEWQRLGRPPLHPFCQCSLIFDHAETIETQPTPANLLPYIDVTPPEPDEDRPR